MAAERRAGDEHRDDASDDALVRLARDDGDAFADLYRRYAESIERYCNRRLDDDERAREAASLVFARAWAGIGSYRGGDERSFRARLFAIANRIVTGEYRRRRTEPIARAHALPETNISYLPQAAAELAERRDALRAALAALPDDQRRIVELRLSGLNGVEIAAVLGRSHASIKSSQFRAYARLRTLLTGVEDI